MGFITKSWLTGDMMAARDYSPMEVEVFGSTSGSDWSKANDVCFSIEVFRDNGKYRAVYLTQDEVGKILHEMIKVGEPSTRTNVALAILKRLPDAELLQFLTRLLSEREKGGERNDWDWLE